MFSFYDRYILPRLTNLACGTGDISRQRAALVPQAQGVVLEVGMGTGLNVPFYDPAKVSRIIGIEPDAGMRALGRDRYLAAGMPIEVLPAGGEDLPLEDNIADTALLTYTMCTIPDVEAALAEIHRVLKPGGRVLFSEHGRSKDKGIARWQDRITPLWKRVAGGCHLNRDPVALLRKNGFKIERVERTYLSPYARVLTYNSRGSARPR